MIGRWHWCFCLIYFIQNMESMYIYNLRYVWNNRIYLADVYLHTQSKCNQSILKLFNIAELMASQNFAQGNFIANNGHHPEYTNTKQQFRLNKSRTKHSMSHFRDSLCPHRISIRFAAYISRWFVRVVGKVVLVGRIESYMSPKTSNSRPFTTKVSSSEHS